MEYGVHYLPTAQCSLRVLSSEIKSGSIDIIQESEYFVLDTLSFLAIQNLFSCNHIVKREASGVFTLPSTWASKMDFSPEAPEALSCDLSLDLA